ncbi:hypothetical protein ACQEUU_18900 [Nonomuraea sp. CA-218870]|uniref:hypothetical protein n=1 Tax=Nonomuraea sp. CA-218870 TaxID=3239998 RepID=UPI003D94B52A
MDVTADTNSGKDCVSAKGRTCRPRIEGAWTLGVYAWTPPERSTQPEPIKDLPKRLDGRPLIDTRSGVWPADDTVRFTFDATGRPFGLEQLCAGDLAERLRFSYTLGKGKSHGASCAVWRSGAFPMAMGVHDTRPGERVKVTAKITVDGGHPGRPVRWSVGLYGE